MGKQIGYSHYKLVVLGSYMFIAALTQLLWLNFASITSTVQHIFNVSELEVGLLSTVFPLLFIPLAIPTGVLADKKGFKVAVTIGAVFTAFFAFLRYFASSFISLLAFQALVAVGQPFVFNSISKLVNEWFPAGERALATGLGTMSLYLGMIVSLSLTPFITTSLGFKNMLLIYGVVSVIGALLFVSLAKEKPTPRKETEEAITESVSLKDLTKLLKVRNLVILNFLFFIGVGVFTAFATWIEKILTPQGLTMTEAGLAGGLIILGGIFGSIVIPGLSDKYMKRKPFILMDLVISTIIFFILPSLKGFLTVSTTLFILGFFLMSALPLGLEISAEAVEQSLVGSATAYLWMFSQIGSVILIIAAEYVKTFFGGFSYAITFFSLLIFISLITSIFLQERGR